MHLRSLTLKGFKSFPDRTRLDFGPGVSVVVGPNGSGKSNVTDAVLWAMGEQSPLAVRGQSMQDVIFGGGRGVQARSAAEVEIVLDNSDGTVELPLSEISIVRRLDRSGEGSYRLNGARCRLGDLIEVLSDTGLGKETHSVISQGRVEQIVTSKPRDRRLLIEEAAGLGKHRKRRRRAQLKLQRTQENLDRALDVEREARSQLRPLKRQAEAAHLHERLERQMLEARLELATDAWRRAARTLAEAQRDAGEARSAREQVEGQLQATVQRRQRAEAALAERAERHERLTGRVYEARTACERLAMRREQVLATQTALSRRIEQADSRLGELVPAPGHDAQDPQQARDGEQRIATLMAELAELQAAQSRARDPELDALEQAGERERRVLVELEGRLEAARQERARADELLARARKGSVWSATWKEVRRLIEDGVRRVLGQPDEHQRVLAAGEIAAEAERVARGAVEYALNGVRAAEQVREDADLALRDAERRHGEAAEAHRRTRWVIEQRQTTPPDGPLQVRRAQLEGELAAERRLSQQLAHERGERRQASERLARRRDADRTLLAVCERLLAALDSASESVARRSEQLVAELISDREASEQSGGELRACAAEEAQIQSRLRSASETVTGAEVAAQRLRDQTTEAAHELRGICARLAISVPQLGGEPDSDAVAAPELDEEQAQTLQARVERLQRRSEQIGPVNPLAQEQYGEAVAHVEELEGRRADTETALRELRTLIRDTDRRISETFEQTFQAAADNFRQLVGEVFPGGSGRLRLIDDQQLPRPVLGGQPLNGGGTAAARSQAGAAHGVIGGADAPAEQADGDGEALADAESELEQREQESLPGVEIEITPAGKTMKRLSLLSGGEKSMTALAFLFAVFLARPCPFYILDEVEAALDDLNLDRFLGLLRRYSDRAQFIVITHQKRTMEAADWLYGVSMGADGVSKVLSRRLPPQDAGARDADGLTAEVAEVA